MPRTTPWSALHSSLPASAASSRPSSRASSPTRGRPSRPAIDTDPLEDYFGNAGPSSSLTTPSIASTDWPGSSTPGGWSTGAVTPGGFLPHGPIEIVLDSEHLVLRGYGSEMNSAYLSGSVELNLPESTNIKEINMTLVGKAKVHFHEPSTTGTRNHHHSHIVLTHDWSFLQGDKRHTHTLKAGHHAFPFSFMLDGSLPSTIHTHMGDADISYKLRANVVRSGFSSNYHADKSFTLHRTYMAEALEFNQTLEIENTWPGKIMYSITLPFKAYAAGDDIPVNVKFMPLAKGVRVMSITSVLKEYTLTHTRHSQHPDQRVATSIKHEFKRGRAVEVDTRRTPVRTTNSSASNSRAPSPSRTPLASQTSLERTLDDSQDDDFSHGDDEINTSFSIPIPVTTTPTHSVHPVFVSHKIKWSCAISNLDGHTSELRCALPIIILDHSLLEEARAAGATTRALLFGGAPDEGQAIDLPSYHNHVYDRVAIAESSSSGFVVRSANVTPLPSPHGETPPHSRTPSRPSSPTRGDEPPPRRVLPQAADQELLLSLGELNVHSQGSSPHDTPPDSRGPSRPLSRRNSRSGRSSRVGSRASSPERSLPSSFTNKFLPSSLKNRHAKPILRSSGQLTPNEDIRRNSSFPSLDSMPPRVSFADGTRLSTSQEANTAPINRVPSYNVASRGWLGGGAVPIDPSLPLYDAAQLVRPHSETALAELGASSGSAPDGEGEVRGDE